MDATYFTENFRLNTGVATRGTCQTLTVRANGWRPLFWMKRYSVSVLADELKWGPTHSHMSIKGWLYSLVPLCQNAYSLPSNIFISPIDPQVLVPQRLNTAFNTPYTQSTTLSDNHPKISSHNETYTCHKLDQLRCGWLRSGIPSFCIISLA